MTDFSRPQRMGGSAFMIIFVKHLKKISGATLLYFLARFLGTDYDDTKFSFAWEVLIFAGICICLSLLVAIADYFPKKFYVRDGSLVFTRGLLQRQTVTVPLDRIHSLRTRRGLLYQMLGMRGIAFDTLASKMEEIELILDESDWQTLLKQIEYEEADETVTSESNENFEGVFIYFRNKYLIAAAFCQNHLKGVAVVGAFLVAVFDKLSDFIGDVEDYVNSVAYEYADEFVMTPLDVVLILIAAYILVMILWVGKALLLYYDMTAAIDDSLLTFSRGLFSRMSSRFSHDKVCTACMKQNLLERKFGLCTLNLRQALFATAEKEEDNIKIYNRCDDSLFLLKWWLGEDYDKEETLFVGKSGGGVLFHSVIPGLVLSVIAVVVLCSFGQYVWIIIPAAYSFVVLYLGICAMRRSKISLQETYVEIDNGRFADIRNYLKYDNIEVVQLRLTPFSRWTRRVSLAIATPGSSFVVRSLRMEEASQIYEFLIHRSETACVTV
ncbi:MAG: PH domain-containing protein [Muribaculum sp.]|nr:PH domain-containing protein [Muribaculum sp.]